MFIFDNHFRSDNSLQLRQPGKNTGSIDMAENESLFSIRVECYNGYRGEESPRRFFLNQRQVDVVDILDRWIAIDHRFFKVKGDDGATYIIRHDVTADQWKLTLYDTGFG
jgi:hypothetical protein